MRDVKMTKKQIDREYEKINYELLVNRPNITPYPPEIVKRRELLLYAQVHLANIIGAKTKRDKVEEAWQECMYWLIMDSYYNCDEKQST